MQGNPYPHFFTFASFCSKVFSSVLLYSRFREIWYQSSSEFARLRPLLVIHRAFEANVDFSVINDTAGPLKTVRERLMAHATTPTCASCHTPWDVNYLMRGLGRAGLRGAGFAAIVFDDDAVCVNWCPQCEQPTAVAEGIALQLAA